MSNKKRAKKAYRPRNRFDMLQSTAARLSTLSDRLTDGGMVGHDRAVDLQLVVMQLVDSASRGALNIDDTNDMALIGNVVTYAASELCDDAAAEAALAWNQVVVEMRKRHDRTGKVGLSGDDYQKLRNAGNLLADWLPAQPLGPMHRAHVRALSTMTQASRLGTEIDAPY